MSRGFKLCFPPYQGLKINILQVAAKSANCAEVARSLSPSCNHLPFRPQYCLRISCYAGIENDHDWYRCSQFRWRQVESNQFHFPGGDDLLCGVVHLHGHWLGRRPRFLQLRSVNEFIIHTHHALTFCRSPCW